MNKFTSKAAGCNSCSIRKIFGYGYELDSDPYDTPGRLLESRILMWVLKMFTLYYESW